MFPWAQIRGVPHTRNSAPASANGISHLRCAIFFMFLPGADDNRTADSLSVGVNP
jgi:hypothetical protein